MTEICLHRAESNALDWQAHNRTHAGACEGGPESRIQPLCRDARPTSLNPPVANGAPRSDVNTNDDLGGLPDMVYHVAKRAFAGAIADKPFIVFEFNAMN